MIRFSFLLSPISLMKLVVNVPFLAGAASMQRLGEARRGYVIGLIPEFVVRSVTPPVAARNLGELVESSQVRRVNLGDQVAGDRYARRSRSGLGTRGKKCADGDDWRRDEGLSDSDSARGGPPPFALVLN